MVGAGVEYGVTNNLTLKAEYNYIDFGSESETLTVNASLFGPATATINSKLTMNVVKFGVNWLFGGYRSAMRPCWAPSNKCTRSKEAPERAAN
jgi:hypothetical protein